MMACHIFLSSENNIVHFMAFVTFMFWNPMLSKKI